MDEKYDELISLILFIVFDDMLVCFMIISLCLCLVELCFLNYEEFISFGSRFSVFFVCLVWVSFSEWGDIISVPKVVLGCGRARFLFYR